MNKLCKYPDWEGKLIIGEHKFDKDGFCNICGEKKEEKEQTLTKKG